MAQVILLSIDRALAERIETAFAGRAEFRMLQHLDKEDLPSAGVIVLDRAAIPQSRSLGAAVADAVSNSNGMPVVLACDSEDTSKILTAVRAGAADVLSRSATNDEIATVLGRLLNTAMVGQSRSGNFSLLFGPDKEAVSILATDMALTHAGAGRTTILIDCTLPKSACETYLDLKVSYGIASAVADIARLDSNLLASSVVRHEPSGLMLLTLDGGTGTEPTGLSATDITALVALLQTCCAQIVFCAGNLRNASLLRELMASADHIELVASQSILELDNVRNLMEQIAVDDSARQRSRLLMWDHQPGVLLDGKRMTDVLKIKASLGVPVDRTQMRNAMNLGNPLALDKTAGDYLKVLNSISNVKHSDEGGSAINRIQKIFGLGARKEAAQ